MLKAISDFLALRFGNNESNSRPQRTIELATAVLLAEMARCDGDASAAERDTALRAVRERLGLTGQQAEALIEQAERESRQATDYFQFTSLINRELDPGQKMQVIELMWRVALTDGEIEAHERHLIHRIADLIYVPQEDIVAAQDRARVALRNRP